MRRVQAGPVLGTLIGICLVLTVVAAAACSASPPSGRSAPSGGTKSSSGTAPSGGAKPSSSTGVGTDLAAQIAADDHAPQISLTLTVDQISCGIDSIATDAGALDAPDGYRYCEADVDITNTGGGTTGKLRLAGAINGDDGVAYGSDSEATDAAGATITTINVKFYGDASTPPIPVGGNAETPVVWELPVGIAPTQMSLGGSGITAAGNTVALVGPIALAPQDIGWRLPKGE